MLQWHTHPLPLPDPVVEKITLDATYKNASPALKSRLDEFAAFISPPDIPYSELCYRYRALYEEYPKYLDIASVFVRVATIEELRAKVRHGWTWDRVEQPDVGPDCRGRPSRIWAQGPQDFMYQATGGYDPSHNWGVMDLKRVIHGQVVTVERRYACCGREEGAPGCWMNPKGVQEEVIIPYDMAPGFGEKVWDRVKNEDWDGVRTLWRVEPRVGTMWYNQSQYLEWDRRIREGKATLENDVVEALKESRRLQDAYPKVADQLTLMEILDLQRRYNKKQCGDDEYDLFRSDLGVIALAGPSLELFVGVPSSWSEEINQITRVMQNGIETEALRDYRDYANYMNTLVNNVRVLPVYYELPQFTSIRDVLNDFGNVVFRNHMNNVIRGSVAYNPGLLPVIDRNLGFRLTEFNDFTEEYPVIPIDVGYEGIRRTLNWDNPAKWPVYRQFVVVQKLATQEDVRALEKADAELIRLLEIERTKLVTEIEQKGGDTSQLRTADTWTDIKNAYNAANLEILSAANVDREQTQLQLYIDQNRDEIMQRTREMPVFNSVAEVDAFLLRPTLDQIQFVIDTFGVDVAAETVEELNAIEARLARDQRVLPLEMIRRINGYRSIWPGELPIEFAAFYELLVIAEQKNDRFDAMIDFMTEIAATIEFLYNETITKLVDRAESLIVNYPENKRIQQMFSDLKNSDTYEIALQNFENIKVVVDAFNEKISRIRREIESKTEYRYMYEDLYDTMEKRAAPEADYDLIVEQERKVDAARSQLMIQYDASKTEYPDETDILENMYTIIFEIRYPYDIERSRIKFKALLNGLGVTNVWDFIDYSKVDAYDGTGDIQDILESFLEQVRKEKYAEWYDFTNLSERIRDSDFSLTFRLLKGGADACNGHFIQMLKDIQNRPKQFVETYKNDGLLECLDKMENMWQFDFEFPAAPFNLFKEDDAYRNFMNDLALYVSTKEKIAVKSPKLKKFILNIADYVEFNQNDEDCQKRLKELVRYMVGKPLTQLNNEVDRKEEFTGLLECISYGYGTIIRMLEERRPVEELEQYLNRLPDGDVKNNAFALFNKPILPPKEKEEMDEDETEEL